MHCFSEVYFHIRYLQGLSFDDPQGKATALSACYRLQADVELIKDLIQDDKQILSQCKDILQQREFKIFTQQSRKFADMYRQYPHIKQLWANLVVPLLKISKLPVIKC